jgi:hypothetical protein
MMKKLLLVGVLFGFCVAGAEVRAEDFKGAPRGDSVMAGGLIGLGVFDGSAGLALMGHASQKIVDHGFVPDINNQVFAEAELGPVFLSAGTVFSYSLHLRWDFHKDEFFTPYAIGGLGGAISGESLGSRWDLFPRFAAGVLWRVHQHFTVRAEVSHELMAVGVSISAL